MRVPEKESQPIPPTQQLSGSALRRNDKRPLRACAREAPMTDPVAVLRSRLLALRDDVVRAACRAEALDGGLLRVLREVGAALAALDAGHATAEPTACLSVLAYERQWLI